MYCAHMAQETIPLVEHFDAALLDKVSAVAQAYKDTVKRRNGKPMNFHLWHSYAQLLVTFEDLIVEAGITSKKDRDQILRTVVGTPRSTARRHRQIFEALDRIPHPEQHRSWKSLLRAAVEVAQKRKLLTGVTAGTSAEN